MSVRIGRRARDQAVIPRRGILRVEAARHRRRVDANVRVVHDPGIAWTKLEAANERRRIDRIGITKMRKTSVPSAGSV